MNTTNISGELVRVQAAILKAGATWIAGETSVSRLSPEVRARLVSPRPIGPIPPGKPLPPPPPLPIVFDWSNLDGKNYVTSVKMQDGGTCTVYASTAAMESSVICAGEANTTIDLSEHSIISSPDGCSGNLHGIAAFIQNTGLPPESWFTGSLASAKPGWKDETYKVVDWSCYYPTTIDEVKALLIDNGPVVTTMNAPDDFFYYKSGVYKNTTATSGGFHAVLLVGYDDGLQAFHCKNSWDTDWGEQGFFHLAYSEFKSPVINFGWDIHTYRGTIPPPYFKEVEVGLNQDSRLEVFLIGRNDRIYQRTQTQPNGSWCAERPLTGSAKQIAVASNQDGRLEVFYIGTSTALFHNWQIKPNGSWNGESYFGGNAKQIVVGRNQDGRLEVFYVGVDDKIYHKAQTAPNSGWGGEVALGGLAKQIAVASNQDGRLEVFYVGTSTALFHNWQIKPNGSWNGESYFGGNAKQIVVGRNHDGRLEVFYVGVDDKIYHKAQTAPNNGWGGEVALGGLAKQIAVASNQDGRLEVFYVGTNTALFHNWQIKPNGSWNGESYFGGNAKQIVVGRNQDGRLEVFYVGVDDKIYHKAQTAPNSGWGGEARL
ncbi:C1 family peptidase [Methylomonas sp. AM2-LC]|uniref:C1 family peptidase n=1 Tax=Methylomonas sp. AM2-LC TaxID=3153301 RepID=UPI00326690E3